MMDKDSAATAAADADDNEKPFDRTAETVEPHGDEEKADKEETAAERGRGVVGKVIDAFKGRNIKSNAKEEEEEDSQEAYIEAARKEIRDLQARIQDIMEREEVLAFGPEQEKLQAEANALIDERNLLIKEFKQRGGTRGDVHDPMVDDEPEAAGPKAERRISPAEISPEEKIRRLNARIENFVSRLEHASGEEEKKKIEVKANTLIVERDLLASRLDRERSAGKGKRGEALKKEGG